jgi:hypothetical protein
MVEACVCSKATWWALCFADRCGGEMGPAGRERGNGSLAIVSVYRSRNLVRHVVYASHHWLVDQGHVGRVIAPRSCYRGTATTPSHPR